MPQFFIEYRKPNLGLKKIKRILESSTTRQKDKPICNKTAYLSKKLNPNITKITDMSKNKFI